MVRGPTPVPRDPYSATCVRDGLCWHEGLLPDGEATQESDVGSEILHICLHVWREGMTGETELAIYIPVLKYSCTLYTYKILLSGCERAQAALRIV